jgi:hypothetical protein
MTPAQLSVTYRLRVPARDFRAHAETAAELIAKAPGLVWKIWGLDRESGLGASVYLFRDIASATAVAAGPAISELRSGPAEEVTTRIAPVDTGLSAITRAAAAVNPGDKVGHRSGLML